jgi:histidinol-phosphatase
MSTSAYSDDLAFAHSLADIADAITLDRYQAQDLVITTKPDNTPVTDADRATEKAITKAIADERPNDGVVGEEFGKSNENATRYWVIDPIDGTKNFMRGVPTWATLIGLVERSSDGTESVVVGVVSAPALARRWFASKNSGAFVIFANGAPKKILVSKVNSIADSSIAYSDFLGWNEKLSSFRKLLDSAWRTRGYGDFWSHMLVAEGAVDVAIEPSLALWDMAALDIIVREAGGEFSGTNGISGPFQRSGLSSNGILHKKIVEALS